jgi:membrane protein implicated in regulation of membrane protease activity
MAIITTEAEFYRIATTILGIMLIFLTILVILLWRILRKKREPSEEEIKKII